MDEYKTIVQWAESGLTRKSASADDLGLAAEWLLAYETDDAENAQKFLNAAIYLLREVKRRENAKKVGVE